MKRLCTYIDPHTRRRCRNGQVLNAHGRCGLHRRTTSERGYGVDHQNARTHLATTLPAPCWYGCGRMLPADDPKWVAAHERDGDPTSPRHAACHWCNERAKGGMLVGGGVGPRRPSDEGKLDRPSSLREKVAFRPLEVG